MEKTSELLAQSFGTPLVKKVISSETLTKVKPKKLLKLEQRRLRIFAKIQNVLTKIERKLVAYAEKPRKVARLNAKKAKLLVRLGMVQENQYWNRIR